MSREPPAVRSRVRPHICHDDPEVPGYRSCGLPATHVSHELPLMTEEQHAAEDRRLGERTGDPA